MIQQSLTQQYVRELFHYSVITGRFTRITPRKGRGGHIGAVAGTLSHGYTVINIDGFPRAAHRLAWLYVTGGYPPQGIDHIDRNRHNNSWHNLRLASPAVNARNLPKRKDNSSGQVGVYLDKRRGTWYARISLNSGELKSLGSYKTKEDAIAARKSAEKKYGYHKNHGT